MDIFHIINRLYTHTDTKWMQEVNRQDIKPYLISRFLVMNNEVRAQVRYLDKYIFNLPPEMWLSLAWSLIPKSPKQPYSKYIKKEEVKEEMEFILKKVRTHMQLSDNDFELNKDNIKKAIKDNPREWFNFYGINHVYWERNQVSR